MSFLPLNHRLFAQCAAQCAEQSERLERADSVQSEVPYEGVSTRESSLDRACRAAGPSFGIVADARCIRGVVRLDVENGVPVEAIPPEGWVS
jgi:hypothetical protein